MTSLSPYMCVSTHPLDTRTEIRPSTPRSSCNRPDSSSHFDWRHRTDVLHSEYASSVNELGALIHSLNSHCRPGSLGFRSRYSGEGHWHEKPSSKSVHNAFSSQSCEPSRHSFLSTVHDLTGLRAASLDVSRLVLGHSHVYDVLLTRTQRADESQSLRVSSSHGWTAYSIY